MGRWSRLQRIPDAEGPRVQVVWEMSVDKKEASSNSGVDLDFRVECSSQ